LDGRLTGTPWGSAATWTLTEEFHADHDSPVGRSEVCDDTMANTHPEPEVSLIAGPLQSRGQQALKTSLSAKGGMNGSFAEELRPDDQSPAAPNREPATAADTKEQLIPIGTAGQKQTFRRPDVDTELTRIRIAADVTGWKKPEHPAISAVCHIVGASAGWDDEL
jgi:hypothetical protein